MYTYNLLMPYKTQFLPDKIFYGGGEFYCREFLVQFINNNYFQTLGDKIVTITIRSIGKISPEYVQFVNGLFPNFKISINENNHRIIEFLIKDYRPEDVSSILLLLQRYSLYRMKNPDIEKILSSIYKNRNTVFKDGMADIKALNSGFYWWCKFYHPEFLDSPEKESELSNGVSNYVSTRVFLNWDIYKNKYKEYINYMCDLTHQDITSTKIPLWGVGFYKGKKIYADYLQNMLELE